MEKQHEPGRSETSEELAAAICRQNSQDEIADSQATYCEVMSPGSSPQRPSAPPLQDTQPHAQTLPSSRSCSSLVVMDSQLGSEPPSVGEGSAAPGQGEKAQPQGETEVSKEYPADKLNLNKRKQMDSEEQILTEEGSSSAAADSPEHEPVKKIKVSHQQTNIYTADTQAPSMASQSSITGSQLSMMDTQPPSSEPAHSQPHNNNCSIDNVEQSKLSLSIECDGKTDQHDLDMNDSQNIQLRFSCSPSQGAVHGESPSNGELDNQKHNTEDATSSDSHTSYDKRSSKESVKIISNGEMSLAHPPAGLRPPTPLPDHDSTASMDIDSSLDGPPALLRNKPYLSNGYTSSTPETAALRPLKDKLRGFHVSDSEGDCTPPFPRECKLFLASKSDSSARMDSTSSPAPPGRPDRSTGGRAAGPCGPPNFHVQLALDDDREFLSLCIINADTDPGAELSREYCKLLSSDAYQADISKSVSPSSIGSGGQLPLPRTRSFLSSSSSCSRAEDVAFAVPRRPRRAPPLVGPTRLRGLSALRCKLQDILSWMSETSGDDSVSSNSMARPETPPEEQRPPASPKHELLPDLPRSTPSSAKRKLQPRGRRSILGKTKRGALPVTDEEVGDPAGGIHSPEMVPVDSARMRRRPTENSTEERSTHNGSSSPVPSPPPFQTSPHPEGTLVLAKWVNRRYYSGKVKRAFNLNKYLIEFDDGHSKTLLDDFIIFGNFKDLPISGQSVYAMVDSDQNYEPGLILCAEEDGEGGVTYKCTTDRHSMVSVRAAEIYLTEDQAKLIKESCRGAAPVRSPGGRRRPARELDLENILPGGRLRERSSCSAPATYEASTSGLRAARPSSEGTPRRHTHSESSEGGEPSRAPSVALEEVGGVQPEQQKTPRKLEGVDKVQAVSIKGLSKVNLRKKNSKITKFENDDESNRRLGPIPAEGSCLFAGMHFILTCTELPRHPDTPSHREDSDRDEYCKSSSTECEDSSFSDTPFLKERLREQLVRGGGTVHAHFEDIPPSVYSSCRLIAPRPCLTAKYIQCLAANLPGLQHTWVVQSCCANQPLPQHAHTLPAGWSTRRRRFINWEVSPEERHNMAPFRDKLVVLSCDNESFTKFWERVVCLAGGRTRTVGDCSAELRGAVALLTDHDCPHDLQNKAAAEGVPLVSTAWVVQSLIEGRLQDPHAEHTFSFTYQPD